MLLKLWQYIRGYVTIEVRGFSIERFMNMAMHRGLYIWDVSYHGASVRMNVSIKGFRKLKDLAQKTNSRFTIVDKRGAPFTAYKFRKRKLFPIGIIFFIALLYYLSGFIWLVEIGGNERVEHEQILEFLDERGLSIGVRKADIDRFAIERALITHFDDISFINIGIRGTRAAVTVSETLPREELIDKSRPCDIIAKRDGVISSIFVSTGTPMVREGDVVLAGDVLVSGTIVAGLDYEAVITGYTHAIASVRSRHYHEINFYINHERILKNFTENTRTAFCIKILNKELNFFGASISYVNYDRITSRTQLGFGEHYPLPIIILRHTYKEFEPYTVTLSLDEMKEKALISVTNTILGEFDFDIDVLEKIIEYEQIENGLRVFATIVTDEEIGEVRYIEVQEIQSIEE